MFGLLAPRTERVEPAAEHAPAGEMLARDCGHLQAFRRLTLTAITRPPLHNSA